MALTSKITLTPTWQKITDDGVDFAIQSRSNTDIELIYKATAPTTGEVGHIVGHKMGIDSNTFGQGIVYGRTSAETALIVVTS